MKKLMMSVIAVAMTVLGLGGIATLSPAAYATGTTTTTTGTGAGQYLDGTTGVNPAATTNDLMTSIKTVINVVIGVVGIIAVVMMIVGGISFITSQGDASKVTKARNTILYGVVGLVVVILAFAIVNFVIANVN